MARNNPLMRGIPPRHPGAMLRDIVLPSLGKTRTEIAKHLRVSRQTLHDILAEKQPITPQMALRIGKLCGNGTGFVDQHAARLRSRRRRKGDAGRA